MSILGRSKADRSWHPCLSMRSFCPSCTSQHLGAMVVAPTLGAGTRLAMTGSGLLVLLLLCCGHALFRYRLSILMHCLSFSGRSYDSLHFKDAFWSFAGAEFSSSAFLSLALDTLNRYNRHSSRSQCFLFLPRISLCTWMLYT